MSIDNATLWFKRFSYVSLFNAFLGVIWTIPVLIPSLQISRTIAGGSVGTWGFVGWSVFLIVGIPIMFASAAGYYLLPKANNTSSVYSDKLAWAHLVLIEVGTLGAAGLLAVAGFIGGTTLLEVPANDPNRFNIVHQRIGDLVTPIGIFIGIGIVGALVGIVNLLMTIRMKRAV